MKVKRQLNLVFLVALAGVVLAPWTLAAPDEESGLTRVFQKGWRGAERVTTVHSGMAVTHQARPLTWTSRISGAGVRWTADYTTAQWIPDAIALGDRESTILCGITGKVDAVAHYSALDVDPPSELWLDTSVNGQDYLMKVSSSHGDDLMTVIYGMAEGNTYRPTLHAYRSLSGTPLFVYDFPFTNAFSIEWQTAVAADGSKFAACFDSGSTWQVFLNVFDTTGQSLFTRAFGAWTAEWLELSQDGSRIYVAELNAWVLDGNSGQTVFKGPAGFFGANDFSDDGTAFAGGGFSDFWVYKDQGGGNFVEVAYMDTVSGLPLSLKLSEDGKRLAVGLWSWDSDAEFTVIAYDVENDQEVWSRTFVGTGTLQAAPDSIDGDRNLDRFVVGSWGDQGQTWPELLVFDFLNSEPIFTVDTSGSILDVAMSADGRHVAASSKITHANTSAFGGYIHMVDLGGEEVDLQGVLKPGASVELALYGDPGDQVRIGVASGETESTLPGVNGTWYLDMSGSPNIFVYLGAFNIPAQGTALVPLTVPANPNLVGTRFHFQGVLIPKVGGSPYTTNVKASRVLP